MCGIIACIGSDDAVGRVVTGLRNLEYRGYDSAGIAVENGNELTVCKQSGQISELESQIVDGVPEGTVGIGHTRWSTHGPPTDRNAHPHTAENGAVAVVHNGIIENYEELKQELRARGHEFTSETDTEVIPHLVESKLDDGMAPREAFVETIDLLEGSYAIAALVRGENTVFATRNDSPLVLGVDDDEYYLASDVPAFLEFTSRVRYLEDGDVLEVSPETAKITDTDGEPVTREMEHVDWDPEETGKGQYDHFMLKEIDSQPDALSNTISGRVDASSGTIDLEEFDDVDLASVSSVHVVACGTSYHAAMYGAIQLNRRGIEATAHRANEYTDGIPLDEDNLVVAVTQSGETADTLNALRRATAAGADTVAVTNVVGSTAAREADRSVFIRAGPEIGVAATKTFSSQAITLALFAERMAAAHPDGSQREDMQAFLEALESFPSDVDRLLKRSQAETLSREVRDEKSYFFIGHELAHPVALEGALKFKEITYEHAEGFASGALKHGPLALVTPETTVFAVFTGNNPEQTRTNAKEAQARGAKVVSIATERSGIDDFADRRLTIPETHPDLAALLANVQLQLISYYTARLLDRPIDKPRNLAKSVTVK